MTKSIIYSIICTLAVFVSCTPKVAETVAVAEVEAPKPKEVADKNPCITFNELSASDRDRIETAYVLYKDQIKLGNYDKAYPLWKDAYYGAPAANGSVKYQFEDGLAIYKNKYENSDNADLKSAYVDTVMMIYDKRVECLSLIHI